jgi:hypothetical protein
MKFGKRLSQQLHAAWKQYYLDYELLKKHIKFAMKSKLFDKVLVLPAYFVSLALFFFSHLFIYVVVDSSLFC